MEIQKNEKFADALLSALFFNRYDEITEDNIDEFYGFLGYELSLTSEVECYIQCTSKLREIIENTAKEMGLDLD